MNNSKFEKYLNTIDKQIDDLSAKQYIKLVENVLERIPLKIISKFTVTNKKIIIHIGFKQSGEQCPFCKPQPPNPWKNKQ